MTNAELVKIAEETMNEIFAKETRNKIEITVKSTKHNGAWCVAYTVREGVTNYGGDFKYTSKNQISYPCTVYAIAGKDNIVKKLHEWYDNRVN